MDATAHRAVTMTDSDRMALLRVAKHALYRNNYRKLARIMIRRGLHPSIETGNTTLLHTAVERDAVESARVLLQRGYSPNAGDPVWRSTPLNVARSVRMAALLLDHGADLSGTVLHTAVQNAALFAFLIARGVDPNARRGPHLYSPLHDAARMGREDFVRVLLQAGADPNALDKDGKTPLDLAFERGRQFEARLPVSRVLLAAGAHCNGRNPLRYVVYGVWRSGGGLLPDERELIELLMAHGADPDFEPPQRCTVSHFLLWYGANPNVLNSQGNSQLHAALHHMNWAINTNVPALILAGGRLTRAEMHSSPHCMQRLAQRFGITEATADWPACVRAHLSAEVLLSLRPLAKLP